MQTLNRHGMLERARRAFEGTQRSSHSPLEGRQLEVGIDCQRKETRADQARSAMDTTGLRSEFGHSCMAAADFLGCRINRDQQPDMQRLAVISSTNMYLSNSNKMISTRILGNRTNFQDSFQVPQNHLGRLCVTKHNWSFQGRPWLAQQFHAKESLACSQVAPACYDRR